MNKMKINKGNDIRSRGKGNRSFEETSSSFGFISSKGLSSVVTAVLLIAVAIVLVTLVSTWLTGLTLEESKTLSNKTGAVTACSASGIAIEDVYLESAANISRVSIRNTGRSTELVKSAQILSKTGVNGSVVTSLPLTINPGELKIIIFNTTGAVPNCGNFSQVIIATECVSDFYRDSPRNC
jgi:flagellin-like protein